MSFNPEEISFDDETMSGVAGFNWPIRQLMAVAGIPSDKSYFAIYQIGYRVFKNGEDKGEAEKFLLKLAQGEDYAKKAIALFCLLYTKHIQWMILDPETARWLEIFQDNPGSRENEEMLELVKSSIRDLFKRT